MHAVVGGPERDLSTAGERVASAATPVMFVRLQLVMWTLMLLSWGSQAVRDGEAFHVAMTVLAATGCAGFAWLSLAAPRTELVLGDGALEVRRRFRPLVVDREDVVAVRGDVPGRPTWSEYVVVETRDRTVRLPAFDRGPRDLIPLLQEWAGVGEQPDA